MLMQWTNNKIDYVGLLQSGVQSRLWRKFDQTEKVFVKKNAIRINVQ